LECEGRFAWIAKIEGTTYFNYEHVVQFVNLWTKIQIIHLAEEFEDDISWTLTADGQYSAASAYKAQIFGAISTNMNTMVWKVWTPPKTKSLAWLALKNRLWTPDRLEKRGWPNFGLCPLCKFWPLSTLQENHGVGGTSLCALSICHKNMDTY
jgi:hypothetical protein